MIPCDRAFNHDNYYVHNGVTYYRWYYLKIDQPYTMKINLVRCDSKYKQAIALFFSDFEGDLFINGEKADNLKGFQHYLFKTDYFDKHTLVLRVSPRNGYLFLGNASMRAEGCGYTSGSFGCAFWIEKIDTTYRFHCNDHEYDDDFDDLVFDCEIIMQQE